MLIRNLQEGEMFGYFHFMFPPELIIGNPFTVKSKEKAKILLINKNSFQKYILDFMMYNFSIKYRFFKDLKVLGDVRNNFMRLMPILLCSKLKKTAKNTLIVR